MTDLERFIAKVDISAGPDGCWPWTAARDRDGYGVHGQMRAHRWLLGFLRGAPLRWDDAVREAALHKCDNAPCVNPAHLYTGTIADNTQDAIARSPGSIIARKRAQTHCKNGHEYTPETTYVVPSTGHRQCRRCAREVWQQPTPEERHQRYLLTGK